MLLELGSAAFSSTSTPADVEVRTVRTPADLAVYLAVTARAFGKEPQSSADDLALRLFGNAPETVAMIAFAGGRTVAAGRLELPRERAFASLWGGGTDPELRGRGIAIVWIEHIVHILLQVAERLICMDAGRIIADGDPHAVMADGAVISAYLGGSVH